MSKKQKLIRQAAYGLIGGIGCGLIKSTDNLGRGYGYVQLLSDSIGLALIIFALVAVIKSRRNVVHSE